MKTISVIGLGNRGTEYMGFIKGFHSKKAKIVALCDIRQQALDDISPLYKIPKEKQFISTDAFFSKGVISDALIIATQDASHYEITKAALETGYKYILLEKPVSGTESEYKELRDLAGEKGALLIICHVLRYSNYYSRNKLWLGFRTPWKRFGTSAIGTGRKFGRSSKSKGINGGSVIT